MDDPKKNVYGLNVIGQIGVPVSQLERAVAFYRDTLGIPFLFQAPPGLAFFDLDGVRLLLDAAGTQASSGSSILYFRCDDIYTAYTIFTERGVTFEQAPQLTAKMPDHDLWMAFFSDPDNNRLALMSEVRPPAP